MAPCSISCISSGPELTVSAGSTQYYLTACVERGADVWINPASGDDPTLYFHIDFGYELNGAKCPHFVAEFRIISVRNVLRYQKLKEESCSSVT